MFRQSDLSVLVIYPHMYRCLLQGAHCLTGIALLLSLSPSFQEDLLLTLVYFYLGWNSKEHMKLMEFSSVSARS